MPLPPLPHSQVESATHLTTFRTNIPNTILTCGPPNLNRRWAKRMFSTECRQPQPEKASKQTNKTFGHRIASTLTEHGIKKFIIWGGGGQCHYLPGSPLHPHPLGTYHIQNRQLEDQCMWNRHAEIKQNSDHTIFFWHIWDIFKELQSPPPPPPPPKKKERKEDKASSFPGPFPYPARKGPGNEDEDKVGKAKSITCKTGRFLYM